MTISRKLRQRGSPNDSDDSSLDAFLKPSNTDYYEHEASGVGYAGARWDDNAGTRDLAGYGVDGVDNSAAFLEPSSTFYDTDRVHGKLNALIDNDPSLPNGKLLNGGGPLGRTGGVGPGRARFVSKAGRKTENSDNRGGRGGRR